MINLKIYKDLFKTFEKDHITASFLTGALFFIFPASLAIALIVNFIMLNFYRFHLLYGLLYVILVLITYFSNHIVIETLKTYKNDETFNYNLLKSQLTVFTTVITLAIFIAILLIFF